MNLSKWIFQSTPPARGATLVLGWLWRDFEYFNPRPPRGGRRNSLSTLGGKTIISIHAPREGGDLLVLGWLRWVSYISIHAPREGGDFLLVFLPFGYSDFNPRPPRGGRR